MSAETFTVLTRIEVNAIALLFTALTDMQPMKVALVRADMGTGDPCTLLYILLNKRGSTASALLVLQAVGGDAATAPSFASLGCILPPPGRAFLRCVSADYSDVFAVLSPPVPGGLLHVAVYAPGCMLPKRAFESSTPHRVDRGLGVQYDAEMDVLRMVDQETGGVHDMYTYGGAAREVWHTGRACVATVSTTYGRLLYYTLEGQLCVHASGGGRELLAAIERPAACAFHAPNSAAFNAARNELILTGKSTTGTKGCIAVIPLPPT